MKLFLLVKAPKYFKPSVRAREQRRIAPLLFSLALSKFLNILITCLQLKWMFHVAKLSLKSSQSAEPDGHFCFYSYMKNKVLDDVGPWECVQSKHYHIICIIVMPNTMTHLYTHSLNKWWICFPYRTLDENRVVSTFFFDTHPIYTWTCICVVLFLFHFFCFG